MKSEIAIIGAGRIAYSLCSALVKSNYKIKTVVSRNINSAKALAEKFGIKNYSDDVQSIDKSAKVFFLSVPDSEIRSVANKLSKCKLGFRNSLFIHLSGAENISLLNALRKKGAATASLHIMQTFPSKKIMSLKEVHAAIETDDPSAYKYLTSLSSILGMIPYKIDSASKVYYHLAGVFASNFLAGNLYSSHQLLKLINVNNEKVSFDILNSTIHTTLKNIRNNGAAFALSGPVDRGDIKTIKRHLTALKKLSDKKPESNYFNLLLNNYIEQSLNLLNLVKEKHGSLNKKHIEIEKLLVQELRETVKSK
ncbi:pyrroline-5-carboxylate reductase [bacterium BMS3Abin03]|nr:pyrroline-5-carboxylate reductase [bacterium BMS3Abin03]